MKKMYYVILGLFIILPIFVKGQDVNFSENQMNPRKYRWNIGIVPINFQMGAQSVLQLGSGLSAEYMAPKYISLHSSFYYNWMSMTKHWANAEFPNSNNMKKTKFLEFGIRVHLFEWKEFGTYTVRQPTGKSIEKEVWKTYEKDGKIIKQKETQNIQVYSSDIEEVSYRKMICLRAGILNYNFVQEPPSDKWYRIDGGIVSDINVINTQINNLYFGLSYYKVGFGYDGQNIKGRRAEFFADAVYSYKYEYDFLTIDESKSGIKKGIIGGRLGCELASTSGGGVIEVGIVPGLSSLKPYLRMTLVKYLTKTGYEKLKN